MKDFFTLKNIVTMAGVVASFVLPHIFFDEDEYEIIESIEDLDEPIVDEDETEDTTVKEIENDQQED